MTEVAKTYGGALYDLAVEEKNSEILLEELKVLSEAFEENPDFVKLLKTPALKKEERIAVLDQSFGGKINVNVLNFIKILLEKNYLNDFKGCVEEFRNRFNDENNIEEVTAVTAVPLSEELAGKLTEKLTKLSGKKVLLENRVDTSVLGGVRLEMNGTQYEGTVQQQLESIRRKITETII